MTKLVAVVIFGFILAGPCIAEAACAWVLWNEVSGEVRHEWLPIQATSTVEQCETQQRARIKDGGRLSGSEVIQGNVNHPGTIVRFRIGEKMIIYRFVCFPDTIDPREKGGAR